VVAVSLEGVARSVLDRPLAHVAMLEAGDFTLGEGGVGGIGAPNGDPERGVGKGNAARVETLAAVAEFAAVIVLLAWSKAGKAFGVDTLVAIDQGCRNLLRHSFEEGFDFGESELGGIAIEVRDVFVDYCVGFQVPTGVNDLRSGGLGIGTPALRKPPGGLREARYGQWFCVSREVTLDDHHVFEDFVCLESNSMMVAIL